MCRLHIKQWKKKSGVETIQGRGISPAAFWKCIHAPLIIIYEVLDEVVVVVVVVGRFVDKPTEEGPPCYTTAVPHTPCLSL